MDDPRSISADPGPPAPAAPVAHPPMVRRTDERPAAPPVSGRAMWAIALGTLGLVVPGVGIAGIVLGVQEVRGEITGRSRLDRPLAIAAIVAGILGVVGTFFYFFMAWVMMESTRHAHAHAFNLELVEMHGRAVSYARRHDAYPAHVAEMIIEPAQAVFVHRDVGDDRSAGRITVGDYDLADFDIGDAESTKALRAALDAVDTDEPFYRFGDVWFARLPAATSDPDVVFAWYRNPRNGSLMVLGDDGSSKPVEAPAWPEVWAADARARARHLIPAAAPPAPPPPAP